MPDEPLGPCRTCGKSSPHLHVFVATLPPGEDPHDVARRDPVLLRRIVDEAKPAGVWLAEYRAAHPEAESLPIPDWMTGEDA